MCGIVGTLNLGKEYPIDDRTIRQMLGMIRHRGPDQFGIYLDNQIGLGSARLSILDLSGGQQPISNEDGTLWIVFNGEVFNYVELKPELEKRGHRFVTNTDTEVILHLYEDLGPECLSQLNGQFAIAIWDSSLKSLFLARDRLGIRPLFYAYFDGALIFGSEIKALLADPRVRAEIDPISLDQIFTYWSTLTPSTIFKDIFEIPPAHYLLTSGDKYFLQPYWSLDFPDANGYAFGRGSLDRLPAETREAETKLYLEELSSLLVDATQIRLRADVPVGAYLSGGLDSSIIAAIIRRCTHSRLDTFSIAFSDPDFDESPYQRQMAKLLDTEHQTVYTHYADIGTIFPEVIWHTETPVLRTAPGPMYLLSGLVQENNYKVVMTGEGADEFLAGYDIFKEAAVRRFWAKRPESRIRPLLLKKLYPDVTDLPDSSLYLASFFREGLARTESPDYSHQIRWRTTRRAKRFFSDELRSAVDGQALSDRRAMIYPAGFSNWDSLSRAQYIEATIFLSGYLLSSQGDRMAMAHSIEGRYPFLDYRVVEFCNRLPPHLKLFGLKEKYLLKKMAQAWLPDEILQRPKRPYRAPIHRSFFNNGHALEYVCELLSPRQIAETALFKADAVFQLVQKLLEGKRLGETDDMALAGIISSQLIHQKFIADFQKAPPISQKEDVKICRGE